MMNSGLIIFDSLYNCLKLYVLRYVLNYSFFIPFSNIYVSNIKKRKFNEASWRVILYLISVYHIYQVYLNNDIEFSRESIWKNWPHDISQQTYNIYKYYMSLYIHQIFLINIESKNTDYLSLTLHHLITLCLVSFSWYYNFIRIGVYVMALHDISDVFLEIAKCFNYLKNPKYSKGADIFFVLFAFTFYYLRLYIYPTNVLASVYYDACENKKVSMYIPNCFNSLELNGFLSLLIFLQILQIYWGFKITNVLIKSILGKDLEDPRDVD